jgi:hypothetical protein
VRFAVSAELSESFAVDRLMYTDLDWTVITEFSAYDRRQTCVIILYAACPIGWQ